LKEIGEEIGFVVAMKFVEVVLGIAWTRTVGWMGIEWKGLLVIRIPQIAMGCWMCVVVTCIGYRAGI